jgi:hypothetical protein
MSKKTYSEKLGLEAFDWRIALSARNISDDAWEAYRLKAVDWTTCACGNQCDIIPRMNNGRPHDNILAELGGIHGFYDAISERDKESALDILEMIEIRSAYLIKKLKKRK